MRHISVYFKAASHKSSGPYLKPCPQARCGWALVGAAHCKGWCSWYLRCQSPLVGLLFLLALQAAQDENTEWEIDILCWSCVLWNTFPPCSLLYVTSGKFSQIAFSLPWGLPKSTHCTLSEVRPIWHDLLSTEQVEGITFCRGRAFCSVNASVTQWEKLFSSLASHFAGI